MDSSSASAAMARTRNRSPSPVDQVPKRHKAAHLPSTTLPGAPTEINTESLIISADTTASFAGNLFDHNNIAILNSDYHQATPFKYAVVEKLFQEDLLRKVKDECLSELSFTEKETDIYKINQTGDLASLNFLSQSQIARLPNLLTLRDALYSSRFRNFLRSVTGCGPLSGKKQDMSVASYTKGCHLLNHDDVIGTRRVSYILYMPLPHYQLWQRDWGGALELYPVANNQDGPPEPSPIPVKSIPPSWNQFIFFQVQPGKSFHSVEEVVVGDEDDAKIRLSISGWFHAPQEGEEGYVAESSESEIKSSREQLTSSSTVFKSYEQLHPETAVDPELSPEEVAFLSEFLNPVYLQPRTMRALAVRFAEESSLELHFFLDNALAQALELHLHDLDARDGLGEDRCGRIPPHDSGIAKGWSLKGPPHKWRYCVLKEVPEIGKRVEIVSPRAHASSAEEIMRSLQNELFPSPYFRSWLSIVTRLMPMKFAVEARRFRPGLDYTLATSDENDMRLDVVLGLTPHLKVVEDMSEEDDNALRSGDRRTPRELGKDANKGWVAAEWGGWECYMAPHNEEDDPAIYRSSMHNGKGPSQPVGSSLTPGPSKRVEPGHSTSFRNHSPSHTSNSRKNDNSSMDESSEEEGEEDSTLLTVQPGYNRLLLVLRDERVMRFVKYVSAAAEGSRWDICGEYEVGMLEEEEE